MERCLASVWAVRCELPDSLHLPQDTGSGLERTYPTLLSLQYATLKSVHMCRFVVNLEYILSPTFGFKKMREGPLVLMAWYEKCVSFQWCWDWLMCNAYTWCRCYTTNKYIDLSCECSPFNIRCAWVCPVHPQRVLSTWWSWLVSSGYAYADDWPIIDRDHALVLFAR